MNDYVINTFVSQRESNMDVAIKYYRQKTDFLLKSLETRLSQMTKRDLDSVESLREAFDAKLAEISSQMGDLETFYNKKIKGTDLQRRIAEYHENVQIMSEGIEQGFETMKFLRYLQGDKSEVAIQEGAGGLPGTINLSGQTKVLETMAQRGYATASAAGGARARLVGEITEQVVVEMTKGNLQELFELITPAGTKQTRNFSGGLTQGKSDMIFATVQMSFEQLDTKETVGVVKEKQIELDLVEAIDLESEDALTALDKYSMGEYGAIGGMTIKQWSDKVLGTHNATFAHSSYTMNLVNERYPNKMVSKNFDSRNTFRHYTAYVISKFLVNVIGVYNILVGNATGIETTASWLSRLKTQKYALEHVVKMENGIWTAKDTVHVGKG